MSNAQYFSTRGYTNTLPRQLTIRDAVRARLVQVPNAPCPSQETDQF